MCWEGGWKIPGPSCRIRGKFENPCLGGWKIPGPIIVVGRDIYGQFVMEVGKFLGPFVRNVEVSCALM